MIKETFAVSKIAQPRTRYDVLASLMEEVGELATEVAIEEEYSSKPAGKDGVVGEAVDVIICALDMIHTHNPLVSEDRIMEILHSKLNKWKHKAVLT